MNYKKLLKVLVLGSLASVTLVGQAEEKHSGYKVPYGMAGCGLGTLIITENTKWNQVGAAIVNNFFFPQSTAITLGVSNCTDETPAKTAAMEQKVFITANMNSLTKEASQGQGEHLQALAEIFGCPTSEFAKLSQTRYKNIYENNEPTQVLNNYLSEVKTNETLSKSCVRARAI